ncbi:MAG TPA: glycosyltransferase [Pyrinomonadaceae bacterium]|nr:glycosyltransferase [Pyrinomonadaceae bacterium]
MKIAVWHNLPSGGGKRALYYHVRGLVERGHEVACWSLDTADQSYLPLSDFAPERVLPFKVNGHGQRPVAAWSDGYDDLIETMRTYDEACRRCAEEIEAGDFDVLFVNSAIPYHMPYIMRHVSMPNVLYLQEPNRFLYEAERVLPWVAGAYENLTEASLSHGDFIAEYPQLQSLRVQAKQEWLNAKACDNILVNSYFSRESVLRAYGVDAKVCYLGIDTSLFRSLGLEREQYIVGLGSCDSIKRIDLAVKAVSLLPSPVPLVWISNSGSDQYRAEVTELARGLGVDLRLKFRISDEELVTTLNKAALLMYTSRLEPFGFAPLEANACGLPVVAVAEGGVRETVQDGVNGFLVDSEAESIALAADRLLQNPTLAREIGEAAALHVQQTWSVDSSVGRLEKFLRQTIASRTKPSGIIKKEMTVDNSSATQNSEKDAQKPLPEHPAVINLKTAEPALEVKPNRPLRARVPRAICTIIAKNYLAFARTLAQSFLSVHPDGKCFVLVVDDIEGYINPANESFEVVKLADLKIPKQSSFCFQYDIKELCTAVKANLLEYLINEKSVDRLLYLDPDILVTGSLEGLFERLNTSDIVLTPHLDTDYPDDGLLPDDGWILRSGIFNLGFIGVNSSDNVRSFLKWWKAKLYKKCIVDLLNGYFVDQKFIDFVPVYFNNVFVEKDVGYNVAYWNLHSRKLSRENGQWLCNGGPLYFFHFSGYPASERGAISAYLSNARSRFEFSSRPDVQPLFSHYKNLLLRNEYKRVRTWPYTYARFNTGESIPYELREHYRNHSAKWRRWDDPFGSPELKRRAVLASIAEIPDEVETLPVTFELEQSNGSALAASNGDAVSESIELVAERAAREELTAILNTRAWRWASRYGRLKYRVLVPTYKFFGMPFGRNNRHKHREEG